MRFQSCPQARHSSPNRIRDCRAAVIEHIHFETLVERARYEGVTEPKAGPDDAEFVVALFPQPIHATKRIDDALACRSDRPANISRYGVFRANALARLTVPVIRQHDQ